MEKYHFDLHEIETMFDIRFKCPEAKEVDYVSESGEIVGDALAVNKEKRELIGMELTGNISYLVPEMIDINVDNLNRVMYFRANKVLQNACVSLWVDNNYSKQFIFQYSCKI